MYYSVQQKHITHSPPTITAAHNTALLITTIQKKIRTKYL